MLSHLFKPVGTTWLASARWHAAVWIAASAMLGAASSPAQAAAPMVGTQAPGYYRMMLGTFEVTALSDGTVRLPVEKLLREPTETTMRALAEDGLKTPVETSVTGYLINTGSKLVLIDAGAGSLFGPTLGELVANLKASGYQPEQIDEIYLTHFHPDHLGGLFRHGTRVFPNAIVRADRYEVDYWLSQDNLAKAPEDERDFFRGAQATILPYVEEGRLKPFDGASQLVPGIRSIPTYGHTPGHTSYEVQSDGALLLVVGDLIHVAAVQLNHPEITIAFDVDAQAAAKERREIFDEAAARQEWIAAAHISFPGIGHVVRSGDGYKFRPAEYTSLR